MPDRLTTAELERAGIALFGQQWQSDIARALDVNPRRVREWIERDSVPEWVRGEVGALVDIRSRELAAVAKALSATP